MKKLTLIKLILIEIRIFGISDLSAQEKISYLSVPGLNEYARIDTNGVSVLPSGRFVSPAGETIRITHDPHWG